MVPNAHAELFARITDDNRASDSPLPDLWDGRLDMPDGLFHLGMPNEGCMTTPTRTPWNAGNGCQPLTPPLNRSPAFYRGG